MLSQSVGGEKSPVDFSSIAFRASTDRRGALRGVHFELGDAEPPDLPGLDPDPVAFRQMLRQIAEAWIDTVYWLPELPEHAVAVGASFTIGERDDVGGTEPGVRMEMVSKTTYTLREVRVPPESGPWEAAHRASSMTVRDNVLYFVTNDGLHAFALEEAGRN